MRLSTFTAWLALGLSSGFLWACSDPISSISSFEEAQVHLSDRLLSNINVVDNSISDTDAYNAIIPPLIEAIPDPKTYPLYGAQPTGDANTVYLEIYSSAEKANGARKDERWLVDVAEAFNRRQYKLSSGQVIQVGIRNIPSGLGAQMLGAGLGKPAGYTPAHALWVELLKADGLDVVPVAPAIVANQAVFAMQPEVYDRLATDGEVTFDRVLDDILAGNIEKVGYCNPYIASPGLNFLYTLLWRSAGHASTGAVLTVEDLNTAQTSSAFTAFQSQVTTTTPTYLDLKQIWLRQQDAFDVIVMSYQSFVGLQAQPGFDQLKHIPFGIPETSPLVAFDWTTPAQRDALKQFADFANSKEMQTLAVNHGHIQTDYLNGGSFPPIPSGDVLKAAQSFWKERKDGGKTVYMQIVVDTSGSMANAQRLTAVQDALRLASQQINTGNQIGLVTFSDRPSHQVYLAPFNELEQKRLFTAINQLRASGNTALYDGLAVGLNELMRSKQRDPDGEFYLLFLTDGQRTDGLDFKELEPVMRESEVRIYPIAYGDVNHKELEAIAALHEGQVFEGTPEKVQLLLQNLFQTNL
ncbi:MAG: VWA domain-containing protein [Cyanobacteria bacterium P01_F01_bin.150]